MVPQDLLYFHCSRLCRAIRVAADLVAPSNDNGMEDRATRTSKTAAFSAPVAIAAIKGIAETPALAADEQSLYFQKKVGTDFVLNRLVRAANLGLPPLRSTHWPLDNKVNCFHLNHWIGGQHEEADHTYKDASGTEGQIATGAGQAIRL